MYSKESIQKLVADLKESNKLLRELLKAHTVSEVIEATNNAKKFMEKK